MKMKKIIPLTLLAAVSVNAAAQNVQDALRFSENNYYGTARSISMGNAFTALGGDLGSINLNPAGSAVNSFSQVTFTPNVSIVSTTSDYNAMPSQSTAYGSTLNNSSARFTLPNVGFTLNFDTNARRGLKRVTFGFIANATANYLDDMAAGGRNTATSYAGSLASMMSGVNSSLLNGENGYYGNANVPWNQVTGWQSGMVSTYGSANDKYIGATEKLIDDGKGGQTIQLADAIDQLYGRRSHGNKYDLLLNVGLNISDRVYVGGNLGIVSMDYTRNEYFKEIAVDPDKFGVEFDNGSGGVSKTYFNSLRYRYSYDMQGGGVYAKFGIIAVPIDGLRIGAAIQTPTANWITEHWQHAGETWYQSNVFDANATSPKGEYKYKFVSPFRANFGVAYTFGGWGLVSVDYEICDYSTMKFKETDTNDNTVFDNGVNRDIKNFTGAAHALRLGAEVKPVPQFAIRAGYNFTSSPERYIDDLTGKKMTPKAYKHSLAAGVGYSSKGSFFCDLAFRWTKNPYEYVYPYDSYIDGELSPEIRNRARFYDVVATFGWRF